MSPINRVLHSRTVTGYAFGTLAVLILSICLLSVPATAEAVVSDIVPFAVSMGNRDEAALAPRGESGNQSAIERIFGESYIGALLFGFPTDGFGGVDLVALAALAYLLLRAAGKRKNEDDRRFTAQHRDADKKTRLDGRAAPPQGNPRDNAWTRKIRNTSQPNRGSEWNAKRDRQSSGDEPYKDEAQSGVTVRKRAEAMWGHLSSDQPEQAAAAGAIAEGARIPAGFDVNDFLEGARTLYVRLQNAWAARNIDELAPFLDQELMDALRSQVESGPSSVDIALVNATLLTVEDKGQVQLAVVHFSVLMKTGDEAKHNEVDEIWTFTRKDIPGETWHLSNITDVSK